MSTPDAAHRSTDSAALAISLVAIRIGRRVADGRRTLGRQRVEILAAACLGRVVDLVGMRPSSSGKDASLNARGADLEVWGDTLGARGVIAGMIGLRALPRTWVLSSDSPFTPAAA